MTHTHAWLPLSFPYREGTLPTWTTENVYTGQPIDAHRNLRGPYSFGGALARAITPDLLAAAPDFVHTHEVTLLTVAPELRDVVSATKETLTSLAVPSERTRFYSRMRTLRLAHGMTTILRRALPKTDTPHTIVVTNVHQADPVDAELIAVLLRRLDPNHIRLIVCTGADLPTEPVTEQPESIRAALTTYATRHDIDAPDNIPVLSVEDYINGDCTYDEPATISAYEQSPDEQRAALHDARAEHLEKHGEFGHRLGAIPFHRERGTDLYGKGIPAMRFALDYCVDTGFYEATLDLGMRGRQYLTAHNDLEQWWAFSTKATTSLAALSRADEAELIYNDARATCISPPVHQQSAYATAMLYTRHHDEDKKDNTVAKGWINEAIAFAALAADPEHRAFHSAFYRNGLALIELHLGNLEGALALVDDGIHRLDTELGPEKHQLHRSVLRYNRAQVLAGLKRVDEALTDYNTVIDIDPNDPEYHFDRAGLLRKLGRETEALADYNDAIRLSPPFPEAFFNRSVTRAALGDVQGALDDLTEVIDIDPSNIDAYLNRAELLFENGHTELARRDIAEGLRRDVDNTKPALHVIDGHLHRDNGDENSAQNSYTTALDIDPTLVAALTARAETRYGLGDLEGALADLNLAVQDAPDSPEVLFNRAVVLCDLNKPAEAILDLEHADSLAPGDPDVAEYLARARKDAGTKVVK